MRAWKNASEHNAPERGVVGRAGNASAFDLHRWAPSEEASRFVEHFWSVTWDRREAGPFESAVITFPAMHLTREWGDDVVRHGYRLPSTLLHGVVPEVFRITISGRGSVVGARFRPGGFTARFGGDAAAMTGRVVPVDDELFGGPVILGEDATAVRFALDGAIGAGSGEVDPTYRALIPLLDRMRDDGALHRVDQVMALSPWSMRTTQRVFRRYVGVTVKWVLCRYRLQQAALEIESVPGVDFADLAVRLGWYDQAHFINDFRSMLGSTPGEYAARNGGGS
ncbi:MULTISPECIES: helix-turn-helix domain-containing protein [unclassified Mycolicibacterium]|uniref:AraC family transcriptional regulator n=1 Tax=unclassified Mycolicibacterium TaxID=2636767 RepID=UPI0012DBF0D8|nr:MULTISPECIES: helix-turn-helix domain-containing protein [unclassified Mycolicibacterium]MUL84906.1 AraC family transcriptional regulator [Mycolicibacterium sp. CBMA 329]MUL90873.1 AraC family transcriptional regulator [Mycolicibacterium sp. CBMA 331]MUM01821.1 AraC family transcriptional regulator [Mycolicibacterium sp. CBMA 334]MUM29259.1 AraC family transcriptional regulator [Mycolicibacterium sp. CBMA 295]MUM40632.1 AraC family transcriptional regulator [Mycolicibacterium sp. CBMA 247]